MPETLIQQTEARITKRPGSPRNRLLAGNTFVPWLRYVLFYAVVANAPFWYARWAGGLLPLGWVCVEYLLVGLAGLWLPTGVTAALLLLTTCADVVSAISGTFYLTPGECLRFAGSLTSLAMARVLLLSVAVLLVAFSVVVAVLLSPRQLSAGSRTRAALALCAVAVGIGVADLSFARLDAFADRHAAARSSVPVVGGPAVRGAVVRGAVVGGPGHKEHFRTYASLWLGRYTAARLWREQNSMTTLPTVDATTPVQGGAVAHASSFAAAAAGIDATLPADARPNLVIVLVESWGMESNLALRDRVTEAYRAPPLLRKYEVREGTVPFRGGTVGGEMRELCGTSLGLHVLGMGSEELSHCLPATLGALGYSLTAVHGMSGSMFDRVHWWPRMRFQDLWFRDRLLHAGLPLCKGPYIGICDDAVAAWMIPRLQAKDRGPQLLYWVSLNSHLPVAVPADVAGAPACATDGESMAHPELCSWSQLVWRVHSAVAHLAMHPLARPTVFLLVGDHAPPFGDAGVREQFSSTEVPYVLLVPR